MSETLDEWRQRIYDPAVAKRPERRAEFLRSSGAPLPPLYAHAADADPPGLPGQYPFTRGIQPTMYRGRLWTMRQYAGQEDAEASNARYRFLLDQGQTGLSVAFDLPTQIGYDSDAPQAQGEVGKVGVAIDSIADMRTLFDRIPLDRVTTSMTINSTAATLLALYAAVAGEQGVDKRAIGGTIQNDILKEYVARGTFIYPPAPSMRLITDIFDYCTREAPRWNTISVSGYHMREAGCTAAQEVGFTLAHAIAYVEAALAAGLDFDAFGGRLSFFFACHSNFLEEIAKFRAARRLWARIARDRFHATNERAMMLRFHTQTGGVTLTAQQPDNNIVRTALQALAAVLGGTQSLHTNSLDEALGCPASTPSRSPCGPSRSSPTRAGSPTSSTRWAAPTTWSRSPTRSRPRPPATSSASTSSAAPSPASSRAISSGRSWRPPIVASSTWSGRRPPRAATARPPASPERSRWASTASSPTRPRNPRSSVSTRPSAGGRAPSWSSCGRTATDPPPAPPSMRSSRPPPAMTTSCRSSSAPSRPRPPSARSPTACVPSGASIGRR